MSIKLDHVSYTYMPGTPYQQKALINTNLEIDKGEFVAIIGHTGSGKSTLVQHLNGLLTPTQGEVTVDGINLKNKGLQVRQAKHKVGMVFQYPEHQLFEETVFADIAFGPRNLGVDEAEVTRRVQAAMEFVGLDKSYADRSPFQLSGGQMRRVAIAGVIALEPEYLVLDEPSAGLDPRGRDELFKQICQLHAKTGIAVVLVSHNMEEVAKVAKRLIVMDHGQISIDGPPLEVFRSGKEKIQHAGVDVPNIQALLSELNQCGLTVGDAALTIDEAVHAIIRALGGKNKC